CRDFQLTLAFSCSADFEQRLSKAIVCGGNLVVIVRQIRIQSDGLLEKVYRLLVFRESLIGLAKMKIWIRIIRLTSRGFYQQANCKVPFSFNHVDDSKIIVGEEFIGV